MSEENVRRMYSLEAQLEIYDPETGVTHVRRANIDKSALQLSVHARAIFRSAIQDMVTDLFDYLPFTRKDT